MTRAGIFIFACAKSDCPNGLMPQKSAGSSVGLNWMALEMGGNSTETSSPKCCL
jgi:hypothetical protein